MPHDSTEARRRTLLDVLLPLVLYSSLCFSATADARGGDPHFLSFDELLRLSRADEPEALRSKLNHILSKPLVDSRPHLVTAPGGTLDVIFWNIDRGRDWLTLRPLLEDSSVLESRFNGKPSRKWRDAVRHDLEGFRSADILVLNEVDLGMKRTGYADVSLEIANTLNMHRAFGVEFVEVDRLYTGEERIQLEDPKWTDDLASDLRVDPNRYRGLHGNAVLSRFPIRTARIYRLPECYDWFEDESRAVATLEKGRRWSTMQLFQERIKHQVRRGGRMALLVELSVPEVAGGVLTVVATHLEDRATPPCRQYQMESLLKVLGSVTGPLVLAGDFNTSGADSRPTSVRREIMKRVTDERFWVSQAVHWFSPVTVPRLLLWPLNHWKNFRDPTAVHIPILAPNRERGLFNLLRDFRFDDGGRFDFTGDKRRSGNGRGGTLAASNERAWKGFRPSFEFERNYFGLVGSYRLDWILVKRVGANGFVPADPRTLQHMNRILPRRLSDHHPIRVRLLQQGAAKSLAIAPGQ